MLFFQQFYDGTETIYGANIHTVIPQRQKYELSDLPDMEDNEVFIRNSYIYIYYIDLIYLVKIITRSRN